MIETSTVIQFVVEEKTSRGWYEASERFSLPEEADHKKRQWLYAEPAAEFRVVRVTTVTAKEVMA